MNFKRSILFPLVFSLFFIGGANAEDKLQKPNILAEQNIAENSISEKKLIPGGETIGVTLSSGGALVVDISKVNLAEGRSSSPAEAAGIKVGDLITAYGGKKISNVGELTETVAKNMGKPSTIEVKRNGYTKKLLIEPKISKEDGCYKLGVWVKDAISGIGTLTFFDPETKNFAALGHSISDSDTGDIFPISQGLVSSASIVSVEKGEKGVPGQLNGIFDEEFSVIGKITQNTDSGIFGVADNNLCSQNQALSVAKKNEVKVGPAYILSNVNGNNVKKYNIEIIKIIPNPTSLQKGMVIKITDESLIEKTGGIVRGMSGSPIIQNEKLVGAITHVFVNDPTKGYGIFVESMIKESNNFSSKLNI